MKDPILIFMYLDVRSSVTPTLSNALPLRLRLRTVDIEGTRLRPIGQTSLFSCTEPSAPNLIAALSSTQERRLPELSSTRELGAT